MKVRIEKQSDGSYLAYNTTGDQVTLLGTGSSVKEAKEDFFNSITEVKESYKERDEEIPAELSEPVEFSFDITSLFEYFPMLNVSAMARYIGINESLMRQYRMGDTYVSEKQLEKIENSIRTLGQELASVSIV